MAKEEKGKKPKEKKGKWQLYDLKDGVKRERKSCPKCGVGVFMAQHEDRMSCGKCGYTEFTREKLIKIFPEHHKAVKPKEEKKEEAPVEEEAEKKPGKK